jgi:hypothetical protein
VLDRWRGRLGSLWRYGFHGHQGGFSKGEAGQRVEVELGFPVEFGVLDLCFFSYFVATTPGLGAVAAVSYDDFHDPLPALGIMERPGCLVGITDGATGRSGWVAPVE